MNTPSPTGNVVFNFTPDPIRDLVAFAEGYRRAARSLAAPFEGDVYADFDGYPVLYLYRHALELSLKAVICRGALLMNLLERENPVVPQLFSKHDLARLLPAVCAIFRALRLDFRQTPVGTIEEFEKAVIEINDIDAGSYAFRYPINTGGQAHLPKGFTINVASFGDTVDILVKYLLGAAYQIDETFETEAKARYEVQRLLLEDEA